jgi:hypothetical protein
MHGMMYITVYIGSEVARLAMSPGKLSLEIFSVCGGVQWFVP